MLKMLTTQGTASFGVDGMGWDGMAFGVRIGKKAETWAKEQTPCPQAGNAHGDRAIASV